MRREGWLRVSSSRGVRRLFVVSDGFVVKCFAAPPSAAPKRGSLLSRGSKARRSTSSRDDARAGDAAQFAAPAWVIDVVLHRITFDFGYKGEMREWLRIWACSAVKPFVAEQLRDDLRVTRLEQATISGVKPSCARLVHVGVRSEQRASVWPSSQAKYVDQRAGSIVARPRFSAASAASSVDARCGVRSERRERSAGRARARARPGSHRRSQRAEL